MNLGASEILLILFVALLLFGGKRLPELARSIGKGLSDFRRATQDVTRDFNTDELLHRSDPVKNNLRESESKAAPNHSPHAARSRTPENPPGTDS